MRKLLGVVWLVIPVALLAFHYGPGQKGLLRDHLGAKVSQAKAAEAREDWRAAMAAYAAALAEVPAEDTAARNKLRLAHGRARMYADEITEATTDLEALLEDTLKDGSDPALTQDVRGTLASMHYYTAWLMRLEGAGADEWTLETEQARQHFRLMAEETQARGDKSADTYQKNLEATIRLARMDLSELKGLPLPKECQGCSDCSGKGRKQRQSRTKVGKKPGDARQQVSEEKQKNAGQNDRPEGSGS